MNEEQDKISTNKERNINLWQVAQKIWSNKKFIYKVCGVSAIIGVVIAFSIPKEYETKVVLAPETTSKTGLSGSMGALASMVGVNLGNMTGEDAISPELYPKIIESTPFLTGLFDMKVITKKGDLHTTLYEYIDKHQKEAWWGIILGAPFKALRWIMSSFKEKEKDYTGKVNSFKLTNKQEDIAMAIKKSIVASVDKKTSVITIVVTAQDPLISASLADVVKDKLQAAISNYRTNKAKTDLVFAEKIFKEAKKGYLKAQKEYAEYADGNMDPSLIRYEIEETRLKNEQNLAFNVYNQVAQQLQIAKAKVQEQTPVYTVLQPATVPLRASSPRKLFYLIAFIFLGGFGAIGWILLRDEIIQLKNGMK